MGVGPERATDGPDHRAAAPSAIRVADTEGEEAAGGAGRAGDRGRLRAGGREPEVRPHACDQRATPSGRCLAGAAESQRLGGDAEDGPPARPLAAAQVHGPTAVFLPDRGGRDGHLAVVSLTAILPGRMSAVL